MTKKLQILKDLPEVPSTVSTFWGEILQGENQKWKCNDVGSKVLIDFFKIKNNYIRYTIKLYLITISSSKSLPHISNCWKRLSIVLSQIDSLDIEETIISEVSSYIKKTRPTNNEHQTWYLKSWYLWCLDMDLPYFNEDFGDFLANMTISGNAKGQAVMSLEENTGPLNEQELSLLVKYLQEDHDISQGKVIAFLFLTLGCNPRNLSLMKWSDFNIVSNEEHLLFLLSVPRIKKRIENRSDFKVRELDQRVGRIFEEFKKHQKNEYIFSDMKGVPLDAQAIKHSFKTYLKNLSSGTELEGINFTPRRLRYTFATKLVMSGVSKERLADLLDHSDLQNVQVYYDLRHKIKGFLTEAENSKLGDIFRRFEGTISPEADDSKKDIKYYNKKTPLSLGKCSSGSLCDLNPPYSCLICKKFNAFSDSLETYKKFHKDLLEWKKKRLSNFDENDRIKDQMDEIISALSDLISRIEVKDA